MSTYIIFSMGEPKYKIKADFYDVDKNFMSFYDDDNNLICSINIDEIDFVIDKELMSNFDFLEPVNNEEECDKCDEVDCEYHHSNYEESTEENKSNNTETFKLKPTDKEKSDVNFDELFERILDLYGKK